MTLWSLNKLACRRTSKKLLLSSLLLGCFLLSNFLLSCLFLSWLLFSRSSLFLHGHYASYLVWVNNQIKKLSD